MVEDFDKNDECKEGRAVIVICVYACMFVYRHRLNNDYLVFYQVKSCHQSKIFVTANETGCTIQFPVKTKENAAVAFDTLVSKARQRISTFPGGLKFSEMIPLHMLPVDLCVIRRDSAEAIFCYFVYELRHANGNPDLLKQLIAKNDINTKRKQYCGNASDVLHKMVAKMASEKYNCNAEEAPGKLTKIFWGVINLAGGLSRLEKEVTIYIQKSDRYYIYTQLTGRRKNAITQTVKYLIYRISANVGREHILLENAISACEMTVEKSEKSSNIGTDFELEKKDQIYVVSGRGKDHFRLYKP